MKKQLHFLLIALMLGTANLISAQESINQNFAAFGDWFVDDKPNGTSAVSGGHLNVTMGDQGGGKYRADLKFQAGTNYTINKTTDNIIAVKFIGDKPLTGAFKVELHIAGGVYINNGGGKYNTSGSTVTSAGNNIYYFDFSGDTNYASGDIEIDQISFTIADVTAATDYTIDWVATFANTTDLEAYKEAKDDGASDTEGSLTLGVNDVVTKANTFKLYPNPSTTNSFSIELSKASTLSTASVKVYNTLGSLVLDKKVNTNARNITINHNLKAGVYLVNVANKTSRLIVK